MPAFKPLVDRFWEKVRKTRGCWIWTGAKNHKGYGVLNAGPGEGNILAHRASWKIHRGRIPRSKRVLHSCDTPACVRLSHLFLGSNRDNTTDMIAKGRMCVGEAHPSARLTVVAIRLIRRDPRRHADIAAEHGCSASHVCMIKKRRKWRHVA